MFGTCTGKNLNYKFLTSNHENVELILEIVHGDSTWKSNTGNVSARNSLWPIHSRTTCTQQYTTENPRLNTDVFVYCYDLEQQEKIY